MDPACVARTPTRCNDAGVTSAQTPADEEWQSVLRCLPAPVAVAASRWLSEAHPLARLTRMVGAFEALLRLATLLSLADLVRRHHGRLPPKLLSSLGPSLRQPTLGVWLGLLQQTLAAHERLRPEEPPCSSATRCARDLQVRVLLPVLRGGCDDPAQGLLALRNLTLAHNDAPDDHFRKQLEEGGHEARAQQGLRAARDAWLPLRLVYVERRGRVRPLEGPDSAPGLEEEAPAALHAELAALVGGVVVLQPAGEPVLDLGPFVALAQAPADPLHPSGRSEGAQVETYVRVAPSGGSIGYSRLGAPPYVERGGPALERFRALFPALFVEGRARERDFLVELRDDAKLHIGREDLVAAAREALRAATTGAFWLAGGPGAGKSTFVARVVDDPALLEVAQRLVVVHRFRRGDARASLASFLYGAVDQLAEWLPALLPEDRRRLARARPARPESPNDLSYLRERLRELVGLVKEGRAAEGATGGGAPARALFVLDGLDEVAESDPEVLDLPLAFAAPGVVWLCVGRDEGAVSSRLRDVACLLRTPGGEGLRRLPGLSRDDVRAILYEKLLPRPDLLAAVFQLDGRGPTGAENPVVERLFRLQDGRAQYLRLLVEDLLSGRLTPEAFARDPAPPSLDGYYAELWRGYGFTEDAILQQQALALLTQVRAPLSEAELGALLGFSSDRTLTAAEQARVAAGLAACDSLFASAPAADGTFGRRFDHESARAHWVRSHELLAGQAASLLVRASEVPDDPRLRAARSHLAEHGAAYLLAAGRPAAALRLLASLPLLLDRLERAPVSLVVAETLERMRQAQSAGADDADGAVAFLAEISQGVALGGVPVLLSAALREGPESAIGRAAAAWLAAPEREDRARAFLAPVAPPQTRRRLVRWTVHAPRGHHPMWLATEAGERAGGGGDLVLVSNGWQTQAFEATTGRAWGPVREHERLGFRRIVRLPGQGHVAVEGSRLHLVRWPPQGSIDCELLHDASRDTRRILDVLPSTAPSGSDVEAVLLCELADGRLQARAVRIGAEGRAAPGPHASGRPPTRPVPLALDARLLDGGRLAVLQHGSGPCFYDLVGDHRVGAAPSRTVGGALRFLGGGQLRRALLGLAIPLAVTLVTLAPGARPYREEASFTALLGTVAVCTGVLLLSLRGLPHRLGTALLGRVLSAGAAVPGRDGGSVWTSDGAGFVRWSLPRRGWWPFQRARMRILERRDGVPARHRAVLFETDLGGVVGFRADLDAGLVLEHAASSGSRCVDVAPLAGAPDSAVSTLGGQALAYADTSGHTVSCVTLPAGPTPPSPELRAPICRLLGLAQLGAFALLRADGTLEVVDAATGRTAGATTLWRPRAGRLGGEEGILGMEPLWHPKPPRALSNPLVVDERDAAVRLWFRSHRWIWQSCSLRELHTGRTRVKPWLFPGRVNLSLVRAVPPAFPIELRAWGWHGRLRPLLRGLDRFEGRLWRDGALLRPMRAAWGDASHGHLRWRADPLRPGQEYRMEGPRLWSGPLLHGREPDLTPLPPGADDGSAGEPCERSFEVSDDGAWVAECVERGPVLLRSGRTHEVVRVLDAQGPLAELSFSPRGRFLLTVYRHEPLVARVWEVASGRLVTTWADRTEIVLSDWLGDTLGLVTHERLHLLRLRGA